MKSYRKFFAAFAAACLISVAAFAADVSPAGTWKFAQPGRGGNPGMERTLVLEVKDGKVTGTLKGTTGGQFEIPDAPVTDGTIKDGVVSFTVTLEFNGNKFATKYQGKLEGDTIKGSIERERNGEVVKSDWSATRAK